MQHIPTFSFLSRNCSLALYWIEAQGFEAANSTHCLRDKVDSCADHAKTQKTSENCMRRAPTAVRGCKKLGRATDLEVKTGLTCATTRATSPVGPSCGGRWTATSTSTIISAHTRGAGRPVPAQVKAEGADTLMGALPQKPPRDLAQFRPEWITLPVHRSRSCPTMAWN